MKIAYYLYAEHKRLRAFLGKFTSFYEAQKVGWEEYKIRNPDLIIYTAIEELPINAECVVIGDKLTLQES